jgi:hypothetical protein
LQANISVLNDAASGAIARLTSGTGRYRCLRAQDDVVADLAIGESLDLL